MLLGMNQIFDSNFYSTSAIYCTRDWLGLDHQSWTLIFSALRSGSWDCRRPENWTGLAMTMVMVLPVLGKSGPWSWGSQTCSRTSSGPVRTKPVLWVFNIIIYIQYVYNNNFFLSTVYWRFSSSVCTSIDHVTSNCWNNCWRTHIHSHLTSHSPHCHLLIKTSTLTDIDIKGMGCEDRAGRFERQGKEPKTCLTCLGPLVIFFLGFLFIITLLIIVFRTSL